jgi:hypothetical protein
MVTITGTNFYNVTAIAVGGVPVISFTCTATTTCSAVMPAGTGVRNINLTNAGGTSANVTADQFTFK